MKLVNTIVLTSILTAGSLLASNYKIDTSHSDVQFKVKHMMISKVAGSFEKFYGTFNFDEKTKKFSSINGQVEVNSITTQNKKRDNHLKSADFFDVKKYPQMSMKLISQNGSKVNVAFTIKDVTKTITMNLEEVNGPIKDPWGYTRSAFELNGKINRKDFNINFSQLLETGGLLVGDIIKLNLSFEGIKTSKK